MNRITDAPTLEEFEDRIREHLRHAVSDLERREIALAWSGYLGALIEWRLIAPEKFYELRALLPDLKGGHDPAIQIAKGFPDGSQLD